MLPIQHKPLFDVKKIEDHYSEKDGVPVKYVCTSAIHTHGAQAGDIFYRATPHPEFGNRYFILFTTNEWAYGVTNLAIANADNVENLNFEVVEKEGKGYYSRHRHDYQSIHPSVAVDGGRAYLRIVGDISDVKVHLFKVKDGEFVEILEEK